MNIANIERAVNARWYAVDAAAFEQRRADCAAAAERGERVASFHQAIGRIEVEYGLMDTVVAALGQERVNATPVVKADLSDFSSETEVLRIEDDLLRSFFRVASRRLLEVVQMQPYRIPKKAYSDLQIEAGPYQHTTSNDGHRDTESNSDGLVHTSVLHGPLSRHANGFFGESDFKEDEPQMLRYPLDASRYSTYGLGEVIVHHVRAGVHAAPPPEDEGLIRIFMRLQ